MLSQPYSAQALARTLIARDQWHPYPTAREREAWDALSAGLRAEAVSRGEELLGCDWPSLPATRFLDYVRDGNRSRFEGLTFGRRKSLADLVVAECTEGRGRFLDDIVNGVWAICEESFWGVPAHIGAQKAGPGLPDVEEPIVDLFAAETSALLAWTCYLLGPELQSVSPRVPQRVLYEMDRRILTPLLERDDFGWMGFQGQRVNNWNPWINSNWLTSVLLMEPDPERCLAAVAKSLRCLDNFIDPYPKDGGCDEGPSYWGRAGASLFDCLELLRSATAGAIDVYQEPLVRSIGQFIYRVHIADLYFVNFADAPAIVRPTPSLVFGYGKRIGDPAMQRLGSWLASRQGGIAGKLGTGLGRQLPALFDFPDAADPDAQPPLPRDAWLSEIQVMVARDREGMSDGLFLAAKGGHNAESHNHNDIGSFIVYTDGKPVLVDAGVEAYTAKTFSRRRYEIWTMQSAYHNLLPTIDGATQLPGEAYAARDVCCKATEERACLALDIAGAYGQDSKLRRWSRTISLERSCGVRIEDSYELSGTADDIVLSLLTPCNVELPEPGIAALRLTDLPQGRSTGSGTVRVNGPPLTMSVEEVQLTDSRLVPTWGDTLNRVVVRLERPPLSGQLRFDFQPDAT